MELFFHHQLYIPVTVCHDDRFACIFPKRKMNQPKTLSKTNKIKMDVSSEKNVNRNVSEKTLRECQSRVVPRRPAQWNLCECRVRECPHEHRLIKGSQECWLRRFI